MLQRVGLDGRRRVVERVCVVRGLSGQRAGIGQRSRSAITEKPGEGEEHTERQGLTQ